MKTFTEPLRTALLATAVLTVVLCGVYPIVIWGLSQAIFPDQAEGSLVRRKGLVVGSSLIGQNFAGPAYFHPRPSAAGSGYDGAASSGTNLGPISQKLLDAVRDRVAAYRSENNLADGVLVPVDAVTASASGLDPHISPRNAELQVARVAAASGLSEERVRHLVKEHTEGPDWGVFGEPRVNVLMLNLALDPR